MLRDFSTQGLGLEIPGFENSDTQGFDSLETNFGTWNTGLWALTFVYDSVLKCGDALGLWIQDTL